MAALGAELAAATGSEVQVKALTTRFFGETVTVAGLLTAQDLYAQLAIAEVGELLVLPAVMFAADGEHTLDDISLAAIAAHYGRPVHTAGLLSEVAALLRR